MKWRIEARILRALDAIPLGDSLHYLAQRRLVGSFPISDERLERERRYAREHLSVLHNAKPLESVSALEFGAGRHLAASMAMIAAGVHDVTTTDVSRLVRPDLVRDAARRLGDPELRQLPEAEDLGTALEAIGLRYRLTPPSTFAGVEDHCVDLVFATSVLEHVPEEEISSLLSEAKRVMTPTGRLSLIVDYKDHYSYSDPSLPRFHFLSIPRQQWFSRFSPPNHFQNRLRHHQVVRLLRDVGFEVDLVRAAEPSSMDLEWLVQTSLDDEFAAMSPDLLGVGEAHLVAWLPGAAEAR